MAGRRRSGKSNLKTENGGNVMEEEGIGSVFFIAIL